MKNIQLTEENLKLLGRTVSLNGALWLGYSASGCEFEFKGTKLEITMRGDDNILQKLPDDLPRFGVFVNGERVLDDVLKEQEKTYTILESSEETTCTVRILKLSATVSSTIAITEIKADGSVAPTAKKALKVEFIGDSITCAFGVDDENRDHLYSTATEDATKGYAYLASQLLDCDYSLVCKSGHGIVSGYTADGVKNEGALMPLYYEMSLAGLNNALYGVPAQSTVWNFADDCDFIVINLGTNDRTYTLGDPEKCLEYETLYVKFLKRLRELNPKAFIICTMGIMGDELYKQIENVVAKYTAETNDTRVAPFRLTPRPLSDGFSASWHPTIISQTRGAKEIAEYIKSKWNRA